MRDLTLSLAACLLFASASSLAQSTPTGPVGLTLTTIIQTETTMIGQPIRFPQTDGQITAVLAEVAPRGQVGRHMHPVPLFVYIFEGTLTIDREKHEVQAFKAGEGLAEIVHMAQRPKPGRQAMQISNRVRRKKWNAEPGPAVVSSGL